MRAFSPDPDPTLSKELVQRALASDRAAVRELVERLMPVIRRRALSTLARYGRGAESEAEDVCQDVLIGLFREDRAALATWAPERGLSLEQFVAMLAQRRVVSHLRSRANKPSRHALTDPENLERLVNQSVRNLLEVGDPARDILHELADRLRVSLSAQGLEMFYRLYVWEQPTEQITGELGLSAESIYQWRSRIKKAAALALEEMQHDE